VNKTVRILLALGLILALAAPAFAEFKLNGYYRLMGYNGELKDATTDGDSQQWVAQRLRMMLTYSLNDNVAIVYHGEVDTDWGLADKMKTNGGKFGADGVNVETKNVYLDLKSGDTTARLGVQGIADDFDGIVVNADMAGVAVTHKIGGTSLKGFYSKWDEGTKSDWDGQDFWGAVVTQKFSDSLKGTIGVYYVDENDADTDYPDQAEYDVFFYGPRVNYTSGNFGLDAFVVFQDGELNYDSVAKADGAEDFDISGFVGSVKATYKIDGGDVNFRFIYGSEADKDDEEGAWVGDYDQYAFVNENQMIMLIDPYVTDWTKEQYAVNDALKEGYGLMAFVLSGNHKLPDDMYFKWGAGYYMAVDEERYDTKDPKPTSTTFVNGDSDRRKGDTIGYEIAARVGKKFFEKVDVSLNAAFADFGDFYDNTTKTNSGTKVTDPDSIYKTYIMVNVPF